MFEGTESARRMESALRLSSLLVSMAAHLVVLGALIVLPLLFFNLLPETVLLTFLAAPEPPPPPAPPVPPWQPENASRPRVAPSAIDFAPPTIPRAVALVDAPPDSVEALPGLSGGLELNAGAVGQGSRGLWGTSLGLSGVAPAPPPPPPPRAAKVKPIRVGGNVQESKLIRRVTPAYPELALRARVSGAVILEVVVDEEGSVSEIRVLKGHPLLEAAAVDAVRQWRYSPTLLNGEPMPIIATVTVIFSLRNQ